MSILACAHISLNICFFRARPWLWRYCDVILGMLVLILVCMERGGPSLHYSTNYMYLGFHFQVHGGGNNHPLGKLCSKKGLVGRGLRIHSHIWITSQSTQSALDIFNALRVLSISARHYLECTNNINFNITLKISDYDYLQHTTFRIYLIDFQLNTDSPSQFSVCLFVCLFVCFLTVKSPSIYSKIGISRKFF